MTEHYVLISNTQLGLAAFLILVNLVLSVLLKLGLARTLAVASMRMVAQLLLLGFILEYIFALNTPLPILGVGLVMVLFAGIASVRRTRRRFVGIYWDSLITVFAASFLVTGIALSGILHIHPWYQAQYSIPLLGMVLGNTLTGISLALDRFMEGAAKDREQIEGLLALGATRWEAAHRLIRESLRTGMIPIINSMMVMGVVSLPGMMTGQLLAGAAPGSAVRYQIVIVFMIAATVALGALGVVLLAFRRLFNSRHQLLAERLSEPRSTWDVIQRKLKDRRARVAG